MQNSYTWMAVHVLVIVAHAGMAASVLLAIIKILLDDPDRLLDNLFATRRAISPNVLRNAFKQQLPQSHSVLSSNEVSHSAYPLSRHIDSISPFTAEFLLLVATHIVTFFGNISNIGFSFFIYRLDRAKYSDRLTSVPVHFAKQQLAFLVFAVFNFSLGAADVILAVVLGKYVRETPIIAAPVVMASFAGFVTLISLFVDWHEYWAVHRRFRMIMSPNLESIPFEDSVGRTGGIRI